TTLLHFINAFFLTCSPFLLPLFFSLFCQHIYLHSFPTRRSSDLKPTAIVNNPNLSFSIETPILVARTSSNCNKFIVCVLYMIHGKRITNQGKSAIKYIQSPAHKFPACHSATN